MSLLSTPSTTSQSPSACMIARSTAYAYFLEMVVDRSEMQILKRRARSLWDAVLESLQPASFAISSGKGEDVIVNHLHDHADRVSMRQQLQQLAGKATVPYSVVGCCEVDKHSSGLLSHKAILDVLCEQGDLVYGRPPVSKACLLRSEQWVNDWIRDGIY